jgi:hypothetical protein
LNTLANLDDEKMDSMRVAENELMNMIIESYKRFFSSLHFANEREYATSYVLCERIIEEMERYEEYAERH